MAIVRIKALTRSDAIDLEHKAATPFRVNHVNKSQSGIGNVMP